jgi:beta-glucosidase
VVRSAEERVRSLLAEVDTAVVVVGNDPHINGRETQDRPFLGLPDAQESLVRLVRELVPRTILVVMSSYPIAVPWADAQVPAIIWTSHAGQETGHALADVLLGTHCPSGRLPQSWYATEADLPDLLDYDIISAARTYLYFPGKPLFPFGHGLSYTTFAHSAPRLAHPVVDPDQPVRVDVDVTNTGQVAGSDVVQCYVSALAPRHERPIRQLAGFAKVALNPNETVTVTIEVARSALSFWDVASSSLVVHPGEYEIQFGRSCADITGSATLTVRGRRSAARLMLGTAVRAADFDDQAGTTLVDVTRADGDAVTTVDERPGWLLFRNADLRDGAGKVEIQVSRTEPGPAAVEFHRNAVDGPVLAELVVPSTGGRYGWTTVCGEFAGDSGVFDLYLVLRGAQRISELRIERET